MLRKCYEVQYIKLRWPRNELFKNTDRLVLHWEQQFEPIDAGIRSLSVGMVKYELKSIGLEKGRTWVVEKDPKDDSMWISITKEGFTKLDGLT